MSKAHEQYLTTLYAQKMPPDSVSAYLKMYEKRTAKLYGERDKLLLDAKMQGIAITVCVIAVIAMVVALVIAYKDVKREAAKRAAASNHDDSEAATSATTNVPKMESHPVCATISKRCSDPTFRLAETSWNDLFAETDDLYPNFTLRIRAMHPHITDIELMVCCLTRLGIRNSDMAHILCRNDNSVSSIRSRLYEKINGEKGSSRLFNEFIQSF